VILGFEVNAGALLFEPLSNPNSTLFELGFCICNIVSPKGHNIRSPELLKQATKKGCNVINIG
jgi:hypothetical protein